MRLYPLGLKAANEFIMAKHRHHGRVRGHKFSIGLRVHESLIACCVVGRPNARMSDDGITAEVTRLCADGTPHACSKLYAAAARAAQAMGYALIITYILESESGVSLKAAGWTKGNTTSGGSWSRDSRKREDKHPLCPKTKWFKIL